jgi:hypothetical protein
MTRVRGAWWALRAVRCARGQLRDLRRVEEVVLPSPQALPPSAGRGVHAVLRRLEPSCLERSLVLQRWLAAQGDERDLVIGVTGADDFRAHAWLEGEQGPGFVEIARVVP